MIRNPILPGFNPDPSICRVEEWFYIATSTFEWYPGVQIHRSRDLANWELAARPLRRAAQLDMRGNPDSGGVWAPCLSYADGLFWLVYTDVKRLDGAFKDTPNYIVTCETVEGEWSDPYQVGGTGFDPSLFHDDDGRKWITRMRWNHRGPGSGCNPAHDRFDGIILQEWSPEKGLIGPSKNIYPGTKRGLTEAPHQFKRNGWYYLTTAEGGTGYRHAVSLARSRDIWGPYEDHPEDHVICVEEDGHSVQRTGHGQYVEGPDGQGWHTFLMGRPLVHEGKRYCPMGRETGIAKVTWRDDWLYLTDGGLLPPADISGSEGAEPAPVVHEGFSALPPEFQWLRSPDAARLFRIEGGDLVLTGRESLGSWFEQALVARRQEDFAYDAETQVAFDPETYQQAAGLVTYYNRHKFHAAMLSQDETGQRCLQILSCPGDWPEGELVLSEPLAIREGTVELRVEVRGAAQQFFWRQGGDWTPLGPTLGAYHISDEGGRGEHASFTGAFVGMAAFDVTGAAKEARFSRFGYWPQE